MARAYHTIPAKGLSASFAIIESKGGEGGKWWSPSFKGKKVMAGGGMRSENTPWFSCLSGGLGFLGHGFRWPLSEKFGGGLRGGGEPNERHRGGRKV